MSGWEIERAKQSELERQYNVLKKRDFSERDIAFHLARYAEAHVTMSATRYIEKLKNDSRALRHSQARDDTDSQNS